MEEVRQQALDLFDSAATGSHRHGRAFYWLKLVQLLVGVSIPVAAAAHASDLSVAILGALVVLLQGVDQLMQWGRRSLLLGEIADEIRRDIFLWDARLGLYAAAETRDRLFAERLAELDKRAGAQLRDPTR